MTETARKWIPIIKEKEHPDIIVGLFHSGHNEASTTGNVIENASVKVAREVPGFDVILMGHDHRLYNETITNVEGKSVKSLIRPTTRAISDSWTSTSRSTKATTPFNKKVSGQTSLTCAALSRHRIS